MRYAFFIIFLIFLCLKTGAQNLVPNGSFEQHTNCPTVISQIADGWLSYTGGSPDYYNSCTFSPAVDVPNNWIGYQFAAEGQAYIGFIAYSTAPLGGKEYVCHNMDSMIPGTTYVVSLSISLANMSHFATDDIGIYFFKRGPNYVSTVTNVPVTPQVYFGGNGVYTDTADWIRLSKTFVADSSYDHIVIGSFTASSNMSLFTVSGTSSHCYYYVDSVVVSSKIFLNFNDNFLCAGDTIHVPYLRNPHTMYSSVNNFTLQLSDQNGNFNAPVTIGAVTSINSGTITGVVPLNTIAGNGYKLRVISTSPKDSSDPTTQNIKIGIRPVALTASSNLAICEKDTLKLYSSSTTSGAGYSWTGPNSFSSSSRDTSIINPPIAASGDYIVTASVNGCFSKDTVTVIVKPLPAQNINPSKQNLICNNDSLKLFSANTLTGSSYSWTGPNSFTSSTQNPYIANPATAYTGRFYITASLNGCSINDSIDVVVNAAPGLPNAGSNSPVCPYDSLRLTCANLGNINYSWTGANGFNANTQNATKINMQAADAGKFHITATTSAGCFTKDSVTVSVYPVIPTPVASNNSPVCIGGFINLAATNISTAILWNWTGPNNFTSNSQNPIQANAITPEGGIYSVRAIDANGCPSQPATTQVTIIQGPAVSVYASPKDTICAGNNMALVALPFGLGSNTPSYEWYRNNSFTGSTGGSLISAAVNNGDVFYVSMIANGSVCNTPILSNKVTMAVLPATPPPSVTISATPGTNIWPGLNVNFTSSNLMHGGNHPGYQWLLNGHNITGATNANWGSTTLNNNDTVCLLVTSSEQCAMPKTASSNCIEMNIATGIDKTGVETLKLYPNPNNGAFTLETAEKGILHIYNLQGQHIAVYNISATKTNIQLPALSNGIYIVRLITTDNKTRFIKLIIER